MSPKIYYVIRNPADKSPYPWQLSGSDQKLGQLQSSYQCYFMAVNLHAITTRQGPKELQENTRYALACYLAAGIDPEHSDIFIQSQVPEHAELAWILNCFSYMVSFLG